MSRRVYSKDIKLQVVALKERGTAQKDISNQLNIDKSVVSRILSRYESRGFVDNRPKTGRPRKTTPREDRKIVRKLKKEPLLSAKRVKNDLNLDVSTRTVQRRCVENKLLSFRVAKKPFISKKNRLDRLEFANNHLDWSIQKWKTVLFSDESKFNLKGSDGSQRVRRPIGERLKPRYCSGTVKHGGGHVMVWGAFSGQGIGPIHRIEGLMDRFMYKDILQDIMLPFAEEEMPLRWTFQQDNDPKHTSKLVKKWFTSNNITVMKWPAQSPDLNPIENLWEIVYKNLPEKNFSNRDQLFQALVNEWNGIPQTVIDKLIQSMPRRCASVIKNNGYSTKYQPFETIILFTIKFLTFLNL